MKKTLVAVAALVATGAFADVTISGVFEATVATVGGNRTVVKGTNGGSEISFGVSEDLGNGLKAIGSSTLCFNQASGDKDWTATCGAPTAGQTASAVTSPIAHYNSYVGVSSADAGTVKIGQQFSNTFLVSGIGDTFGRAAVSNYKAGGAQAQIANSLNYVSPSFSGVSVAYQQALDNTVASYTSYAINYTNGALTAGYASGKTGATTEQVFGANYDFGVAKISAGSTTSTGVKTATGYGVAVPFGAVVFAVGTSSDKDGNATQYGVTYMMSKRTSVYAANGVKDGSPSTTLLGLRHNF